jgi:hypothetical protein
VVNGVSVGVAAENVQPRFVMTAPVNRALIPPFGRLRFASITNDTGGTLPAPKASAARSAIRRFAAVAITELWEYPNTTVGSVDASIAASITLVPARTDRSKNMSSGLVNGQNWAGVTTGIPVYIPPSDGRM